MREEEDKRRGGGAVRPKGSRAPSENHAEPSTLQIGRNRTASPPKFVREESRRAPSIISFSRCYVHP